ncbi:hypothetical protein FQR65_LT09355 [Abscondita terminalis]|nr:hypothetical protein FQR65_LT09355 [Abscondita terminalis]
MLLNILLVIAGLFHSTAAADTASSLPSKEEQSKLLKSVEEVFETVRTMVQEERVATDAAAALDMQDLYVQSLNHLVLVKELSLSKLANQKLKNEICEINIKTSIQKVVEEGEELLKICLDNAINNIYNNSEMVTTAIGEAMNQGDAFLDGLNKCSQKPGFQLISCYKKVIAADVFPLKLILINALNVHKSSHLAVISVKRKSAECVENVLKIQQEKMNEFLKSCAN